MCIEDLKAFLRNQPAPNTKTIYEVSQAELQAVYRRGAEALEAWANGATADEMAKHVRDMLVQAKQEAASMHASANGKDGPKTILGVTVSS